MMSYLPNAPFRWKELIGPQKAHAILSLKYATTTTNIYSETNWHILYYSTNKSILRSKGTQPEIEHFCALSQIYQHFFWKMI